MKDDIDLDKVLKASRIPERPTEYWQRFPQRVLSRLKRGESAVAREPVTSPWFGWGLGLAAAFLAVGVVIGILAGGLFRPAPMDRLAKNRRMFREVAAMFPHRIQAILLEGNNVKLVLSDRDDVPSSPPLLVTFCRDSRCESIITFSGQQIKINGESWDVLTDSQGHVMVVGNDAVWSSNEPANKAGRYHIDAQPLGESL